MSSSAPPHWTLTLERLSQRGVIALTCTATVVGVLALGSTRTLVAATSGAAAGALLATTTTVANEGRSTPQAHLRAAVYGACVVPALVGLSAFGPLAFWALLALVVLSIPALGYRVRAAGGRLPGL